MPYLPGRKKPEILREERGSLRRDPRADRPNRVVRSDLDLEKLKNAYHELEVIHHETQESHVEMILNLAIAAEYKDPDTGSHILRISDYAAEVAKALGLSAAESEILRYASPMHDIGKLGIPDKILQKPGKLTPEEWEIMKQHTIMGFRIFKNSKSPLLKAVSAIALTHHERYDGTGYPHSLKGDLIPLYGRIVAMVDVFDAVTTKRCYKEKSSFQEGVDYIQSLAGSHLDPKLVKLFKKIEKNIRQVHTAGTTIQQFVQGTGLEEVLGFEQP